MPNAQIARQHSFTGAAYSIAGVEDPQTLDRLRADLIADYQPVNSQELFAVERIALAQLSLLRVARLEAGLFDPAAGAADPVSQGFHRLAGRAAVMPLFLRYQAQCERNYRRAVEDLNRLKKLRKELSNQCSAAPQEPPPPPTRAAPPPPVRPAAPGGAFRAPLAVAPRPAGDANASGMTAS